ncbi:MAG: 2-phospho-L-lactate guanylyltransferase [Intrasporangium sp.]|uniref:2-phospho-L-lactate guanylyltransferase n=1 Tax=Intrasporangium sp. TaxID=1925024 RepID=UPI002647ED23|nr:2-phospho-L-lactate guanylyltransferase [Intrasporangium sp.]MDN5794729.1 2-phospho-L-lactate guanylyltransferase [Intrasporangium sp.]
MANPSEPTRCWHIVVPVKDTRAGKSRLALPGAVRSRVSRAIADDTLSAVVATVGVDRTWLVTSDPGLSRDWAGAGVHVVPDPGGGLNHAIRAGLGSLPDGWACAVLLGDLPCLTPGDLGAALEAGERVPEWFVPDQEGSGTVLRGGKAIVPQFGPDSAAAHAGAGAARLDLDLPRLRRDVDDPVSLAAAVRLGLGPATCAALGLVHTDVHADPGGNRTGA